ncbi:MAG: hypothetical protein ABF461_08600 [Zymomonas mobilis subsp. pomaceae]|nr:hypothetical protein [Zymomonas mobilis]MDX5947834.1 hypothetical protein [Zymomonas mobilis subsp. pomaceae]
MQLGREIELAIAALEEPPLSFKSDDMVKGVCRRYCRAVYLTGSSAA